ncbi:HEAT repeat domain-containing protein [Herbiconiux moechotypicola]|uniref:HEAT repeat domain-containing protein n=1 Tax=Herbiconiux moechotypicola TaxID=637393 RepID=UPI00217D1351|nr:HEAT repeat domain-containing protein [Herbiconiux moechotypicola]MCS5731839.1 HEAT repeat domain-containing protein [Herbiconiux moechotypicola]
MTAGAADRLRRALLSEDASARLQAALAAGTRPQGDYVEVLVARSAVEPDFFVREMLTWALVRHPPSLTVPRLIAELGAVGGPADAVGERSLARSQSLHTLSKIGDPSAWPAITSDLLHDGDDEVARAAWRAAVVLVPEGGEPQLAAELVRELAREGHGDEVQRSLARALAALGEAARAPLEEARESSRGETRVLAATVLRLLDDPDEAFESALFEARRSGER